MKKLIVIVVLLLLGGGGAAAWWFYFKPSEVAPVEPTPDISQIELTTLSVARIKNDKADKLFNFQIVLLFDDPDKRNKVHAVLPDVLDSIVIELHQLLPRKIMEQNDFDQELIRLRLEKAVVKRIGQGWIHRLSIRNMEQIELR